RTRGTVRGPLDGAWRPDIVAGAARGGSFPTFVLPGSGASGGKTEIASVAVGLSGAVARGAAPSVEIKNRVFVRAPDGTEVDRADFSMAEDSRKLFVAGLPDSITEDVLRQLFEATGGSVVEVSLPKDRATGRPRGFGFVTLATVEEATSARESLDGSFQGGKSISVRPFQAEPPRREGRPM